MKKLLLSTLFILTFIGCGEDGGSGTNYNNIQSEDFNEAPHPNPTSDSEEFPPHTPQI
jgi:hypothetical protein